jgi:hypothetical protein
MGSTGKEELPEARPIEVMPRQLGPELSALPDEAEAGLPEGDAPEG